MRIDSFKSPGCSFLILLMLLVPGSVFSQSAQEASVGGEKAKLVRAVMAEAMEGLKPMNEAVIFSTDLRRIVCFTEFDQVPKATVIYHKWYQRGVLIAQKQLTLKPPRWASFSSMQLRSTDIGPWQVDILDDQGQLIKVLRFSITE